MLAGVRRSGKTYLMFQLCRKFGENAFYVDLEDERIVRPDMRFLYEVLRRIEEKAKEGKIKLLIDEIQNVGNWEKFARRIAEKKNVFYLSPVLALSLHRKGYPQA